MAQKERIQPSTVDLVHLVPFCLSLLARLLYGQREGLQDMMNTMAGWMEPAPAGDKFHPWAG